MENGHGQLAAEYANKPAGYFENSRNEMLDFVPRECMSVLDVGCGEGNFGALLKQRDGDCEVWGVELDAKSADIAASKLDRVITKPLSTDLSEFQGKRFDAITFLDVLEHMVDPESALREAAQLLTPNGVVVASIPNILYFHQISEILIEQDWRYREYGILDNSHLRFFTKKSIIRMFENCGFRIEKIEGISPAVGMKFHVANLLALGRLKDWKYVQFAVVAKLSCVPTP